jgi:hypothetical protein
MAEKCSTAPISEPTVTTTPATNDAPVYQAPIDAQAATAIATIPVTTAPIISPEEAKRDKEVIKARAEKLLLLLRA